MEPPQFTGARILIADDEPDTVFMLERLLADAGYQQLLSTTDLRAVPALFATFQPDLVMLDVLLPDIDGVSVIALLHRQVADGDYLPILVLTADVTTGVKERALLAGAKDFLTKPFDRSAVLLRTQNLLETRYLYRQLQTHNAVLEENVRERTQELAISQMEVLERLAHAAEYRDDTTRQHTKRVGRASADVAHAMELPAREVDLIRLAAPLHDVGKIAIPDAILLKPGRLSAEEFAVIQTHTTIGATVLAAGTTALVQLAETIALTHHERWDGAGYPRHMTGEAIPLAGRIVAVVDVFDALTHDRPYKRAWQEAAAITEIASQAGQQFDPQVVAAWLRTRAGAALVACERRGSGTGAGFVRQ